MPSTEDFKKAATLAVKNTIKYGDTDIFPFPFERFVFRDCQKNVVKLLEEYNSNFSDYLAQYSPVNVSALSPVSYFGFRWATQIDYIWNAYFLACTLLLADKIEAVRISKEERTVFSYRLSLDMNAGSIFDQNTGFRDFLQTSLELSSKYNFVVICDVSEFYPRLGHHRLENALKQVDHSSDYPKKIMNFLSNFSSTNSFGLPVGGPAARILSELTINQIDRLLLGGGIRFTRFADDYHIFANSKEDAYKSLIFVSEKLSLNQGLTLQKAKTRIMTSAEFQATVPAIGTKPNDDTAAEIEDQKESDIAAPRERILNFSLRFDPYSPTAEDDYERLRAEIRKYDVLALLKDELTKTRVHTALTKKLVRSIKFLEADVRDQAVLSIIDNSEVLYPVFSSVLLTLDQIIDALSQDVQQSVKEHFLSAIEEESHIFRVDIHLAYALRLLSHFTDPETVASAQKVYETRTSPIIRRDVILAMARWGEWYWLSDIKNNFRQLSGPERRAFIVASYTLKDEGKHWRDHIKPELSPFEKLVKEWACQKANEKNWSIFL